MPKMKTNRMARKRIRVAASGRLKKAQANTSHNSGKKPNNKMRRLKRRIGVDSTSMRLVRGLLPYAG